MANDKYYPKGKTKTKNTKENNYETNPPRRIAESYETKTKQNHDRFAFDVVFRASANSRTGWQPAWFANTHADTESHNYTITDADIHPRWRPRQRQHRNW